MRAASSPTTTCLLSLRVDKTSDGVARSQADPIKHVIDADIPQSGNLEWALLELSDPARPRATEAPGSVSVASFLLRKILNRAQGRGTPRP